MTNDYVASIQSFVPFLTCQTRVRSPQSIGSSMFVLDGAKFAKNLVEDTGKGLISTLSFGRRDKSLHKTNKKLPVVKLEIVSDTVW